MQDVIISCATKDCKILGQNHELLIDAILENYEFAKIVVVLSTTDDEWIESFKVNYTEVDEEELEELQELENNIIVDTESTEDINNTDAAKFNRFKIPKPPRTSEASESSEDQPKHKLNLILVSILQHLFSLITEIIGILQQL
ncbi:hypothetical protein CrV_gp043 [Cylindrospermopsis raciborskii virus RM-2018a]|nr:hypothetical protein CrV_gp043 [Cylindrospermopsis raciborskii virus RM-2018a]